MGLCPAPSPRPADLETGAHGQRAQGRAQTLARRQLAELAAGDAEPEEARGGRGGGRGGELAGGRRG